MYKTNNAVSFLGDFAHREFAALFPVGLSQGTVYASAEASASAASRTSLWYSPSRQSA
jgi:hypothetical protein